MTSSAAWGFGLRAGLILILGGLLVGLMGVAIAADPLPDPPAPPSKAASPRRWWPPFRREQPPATIPRPESPEARKPGPRTLAANPDPLLRLPRPLRLESGQTLPPGFYRVAPQLSGDRPNVTLIREGERLATLPLCPLPTPPAEAAAKTGNKPESALAKKDKDAPPPTAKVSIQLSETTQTLVIQVTSPQGHGFTTGPLPYRGDSLPSRGDSAQQPGY